MSVQFILTWMQTPNPMLGGVTPLWMLESGRGEKLAAFIRQAIADNESPPAIDRFIRIELICERCGADINREQHRPECRAASTVDEVPRG